MLFQSSLGIHVEQDRVGMVFLKSSFKGIVLGDQTTVVLDPSLSPEERMEAVSTQIRNFAEANRITPSSEIYMTIPRKEILYRWIDLPAAAGENLRETIGYEMEKFTPFPSDALHFDVRVVQEDRGDGQIRVLLLAVRKKAVEPFLDVMRRNNLGLSGIESVSSALVNAVTADKEMPGGNGKMVLFSGDGHLEGMVLRKNQLLFSKFLEIGAQPEETFADAAFRMTEELREKTAEEDPPSSVLCAGDPFDDAVLRDLGERRNLRIDRVNSSARGIQSPALLPAYGLALKGVRKVPLNINFLPRELRKKASRAGLFILFALSFLVLLSTAGWLGSSIAHQRMLLDRLNGELETLTRDVQRIERLGDKVRTLEGEIDFLNGIAARRVRALDLMKELAERIPETAWTQRFSLSGNTIEIEGYADAASDLLPLLEASPRFENAGFLSPITKGRDGKERFRIGLKIQ
ncbi:MAG TPA: PilN domain-containing protein [Syntrophales bacterium]|mgnify:CR=1 FL=1|nr:PilN domain-containing protein [Syntrophales bacterium]